MKYIEAIKSIVLLLLVALSITFTFSIWTYTPRYETIEQSPSVDISIAEKKTIDEIIKPYKVIFNSNGKLTGTYETKELDYLMGQMRNWKIYDVTLADSAFVQDKQETLMHKPNRFIVYFQGEVPLIAYDNILHVVDTELPETTFDRLVVDWNPASALMTIHFINRSNELLYNAKVSLSNENSFNKSILAWARELGEYKSVEFAGSPLIGMPVDNIRTVRNTYFQMEVSPSRFRNALFTDPNAVRRSQVGPNQEEYQDDHALMSIDSEKKMLSFSVPAAESFEQALPSELFLNTFEFINDHGGWTGEFRYAYMNPLSRYVKYQLYVSGLPVFGDISGFTEISQVWGGDKRIYRYMRPYYTLDVTLPLETDLKYLEPGTEVVKTLMESEKIDFSTVEEILPGYYIKHDVDRRLYTLEPYWYYLIKGNWIRYSPEQLGGGMIGLE